MTRRSNYPFRKSDTKFGTNLIASLFSIPIALGVAAMSDAFRTLPSSFSKNGTRKTSAVTERTIVILACIGVTIFLFLGIYWVTLPDEYFLRNLLGKVLILIYAPTFLVLTILIVNDIKQKRIALETRNGYVWEVIDDDLWGILYQSLNIELYFHFTRPYLTKKEYQTIKSPRFLTKIETYDEYDKAWYQYYWYYSFQMKVHDTIKDVLLTSDESLQVMSESEYTD